ncbi:Nucleoporin NUP53 [Orchesella cincta]|uniref:Nucleoporin NUP35 n=1 Tax=Orchesella cincta TaxID=48709 RepID=A0A1D2MWT2_ORCCI|nr:Nucleoporin NUP53 [Orchesella cincta]
MMSSKMFGAPTGFTSPSFTSPSQPQASTSMMGGPGGMVSPNISGFNGVSYIPSTGGSSPILQSPSDNKFPAGGGPVVFTPQRNVSPGSVVQGAAPASPYSFYAGGTATSFIQSPPPSYGGPVAHTPPPFSSTMMVSNTASYASPLAHGYAPPQHFTNSQPYGYGVRAMGGNYNYHSPAYQHHPPPQYGQQHSPRDEIAEPMHCSPVGQTQHHAVASPSYQQIQRSPPRPHYLPTYFTGIDHLVASVPARPRRVFERSPSTSPPVAGGASRSPQSKSPTSWFQQEGGQLQPTSFGGPAESTSPTSGSYAISRGQVPMPNRQLRFTDTQHFQDLQAAEEKEKAKRSGPPVRGFGTSEEVNNFINSPLLQDNNNVVPGAAISQEAIAKARTSNPIAESNWITVFGFPAAAAAFILTHFSQYGSVIQSKSNPGGNWLHIQYSSRIDARRALACNGKVLGGTIMVGVVSSPKEVIETYEKPQRDAQTASGSGGPSHHQPSTVKSPLQERNADTPEQTKIRIRPLAGNSQVGSGFTSPVLSASVDKATPGSSNETNISVLKENQNENIPLPTASSGMLTKAMEYMFGW